VFVCHWGNADSVQRTTYHYSKTVFNHLEVLRAFDEGCPKVFVIRAVMQLSHFLGYRSNNFYINELVRINITKSNAAGEVIFAGAGPLIN
jgi:hypothetical protein